MSYSFHAAAQREYLDAVQFYEDQRAGLGLELIQEFERVVAMAVDRPEAWRLVHAQGIRRIGLTRFPYIIFYRVLPQGTVHVTAFAHHKRHPGYWATRI